METQEAKEENQVFKVLFVGDKKTGKTNLFERFQENGQWKDTVNPTVSANFNMRRLVISDKTAILQVWDIPGDEVSEKMCKIYYKGSHANFIVYDISNMDSFIHVHEWLKNLREYGEPGAQIVLVGNKCELEDERQVSFEEGKLLAEKEGLLFVEVSARTGENINYLGGLIAGKLVEKLIEKKEEVEIPPGEMKRFEITSKNSKMKQKKHRKIEYDDSRSGCNIW